MENMGVNYTKLPQRYLGKSDLHSSAALFNPETFLFGLTSDDSKHPQNDADALLVDFQNRKEVNRVHCSSNELLVFNSTQ